MRIKLLIAVEDGHYAERLSCYLSDKYSDAFEVTVCGSSKSLKDFCASTKFDVALLDEPLARDSGLGSIHLPLLLYSEDCHASGSPGDMQKIRKYQRISSIAGEILGNYSKVSAEGRGLISGRANVTAFWSPAGGVGTTTAALAYSARVSSAGRQALYLNLESFSSSPFYFSESGKSISAVFEMLENQDGNVKMLIRGILLQDSDSGISYFRRPENYDDMNILSIEDTTALIAACSGITDELVIDLSCICNKRTWQVFELADRVMILVDSGAASQVKLSQFTEQHNVYERVKAKAAFVANKGARLDASLSGAAISLPLITSCDEKEIYRELSASFPSGT